LHAGVFPPALDELPRRKKAGKSARYEHLHVYHLSSRASHAGHFGYSWLSMVAASIFHWMNAVLTGVTHYACAGCKQDYSDSESDATQDASECHTDSDQEDYRQLELPEVVLAGAEPALDDPLSSLSVIPYIVLAPRAHFSASLPSRRDEESSGDALPDLIASSSSEESMDDDEQIHRNVRPRHAESFTSEMIAMDMGSPLISTHWGVDAHFQRDASALNNRQGAPPLFFQRPAGNPHMPYPHMPFPNMPLPAETRTRANTSMHSPYQSWNSSGGFPEVAPRTFVQVLDTQTGQTWPVDQGMPGNGGARGGLPNLAPVDLLSSILGLGMSGMRLDPNSPAAAQMRNMHLDPILQVRVSNFKVDNLHGQQIQFATESQSTRK